MKKSFQIMRTPSLQIIAVSASLSDYYDAVSAADELESLSRKVQIQEMVKLMKAVVPEFISKNSKFEKLDQQ